MANNRSFGQKLIPIPVNENFEREMEAGLSQLGCRNRSQFIRDAIIEKLARAGISIPPELALPPRRHGKAQEAKNRYPVHRPSGYALNEKPEKKSGRKGDK